MIGEPNANNADDDATLDDTLNTAANGSRQDRMATLHALHALEYAVAAPAPRRQRTWVHRVAAAVDVLTKTLDHEATSLQGSRLLAALSVRDPTQALAISRLRHELDDLRIAATALRDQIECTPPMSVDAPNIRDRLATLTRRYRHHSANEADLVYELMGLDLTNDGKSCPPPGTHR